MDIGLFFLVIFVVIAASYVFDAVVSAWRGRFRQFGQSFTDRDRPRPPVHVEWTMTYGDGLNVRAFTGCGCPIGRDHWDNGEWKR
jgi:hypothetical protein